MGGLEEDASQEKGDPNESPRNWVQNERERAADARHSSEPHDLYLASLHWSVMTLTSIGYGDISAKNTTERVAEIVTILVDAGLTAQGIIAIQTADRQTLKTIRRENIRTEAYDRLVDVFRERKLPLTTDLMLGLPGSTPITFAADLELPGPLF